MASNKRTVIEVSSGSDDDNPLVNRRRKIRRQAQPQREADPEQMRHKAREFLAFLDSALPRSLFACDVADYIQRESNIRLALARQQGVSLENISVGRDCLPTWPEMQWDPEKESLHCAIQNQLLDLEVSNVLGNALRGNGHGLENPFNEQAQGEELMDDGMGQSSIDSSIPHSFIFSRAGTPDSHECDDAICMDNAVHPQPEYSESDDDAPHILHDVEVAGCREGHPDIDLEVYAVENDSDVDNLPELELAIDGDAFAYYFGDDGAVEVEIPGMDLRCSLDVPLDLSSEEGDDDLEVAHVEEEEDDDIGDENSLFNEDQHMDGQEDDGANTQLDGIDASLRGIQVTEDGFIW
ncbi:hypothetical protein J3F83DRAFT_764470 [Trichoderma novae-zelandiae]